MSSMECLLQSWKEENFLMMESLFSAPKIKIKIEIKIKINKDKEFGQ